MWKTIHLTKSAGFYIVAYIPWAWPAAAQQRIPNPIKSESFPCLVQAIARGVVQVAIPVAVIALIFVGLKFIFASVSGETGKIASARKELFWLVIGIAVVVGSFAIASAVVTFLGGETAAAC